jgi:hypothetical protein
LRFTQVKPVLNWFYTEGGGGGGCQPKKINKTNAKLLILQGIGFFFGFLYIVFYGFFFGFFGFLGIHDFLRKRSMKMLTIFHGQKRENWLIQRDQQKIVQKYE